MSENIKYLVYINRFNEVKAYSVEAIAQSYEYLSVLDTVEQKAKSFKLANILFEANSMDEATQKAAELQSQYEIIPRNKTGKTFANPEHLFEVCFTGFSKNEKQSLIGLAEANGLFVRTSVTAKLGLLICGETAGWAKIKKAAELNVPRVFGREGFETFIQTGEVYD